MKKILLKCDSMQEKGGVERLVALQSALFSADYEVKLLTRYSFSAFGFQLDKKCDYDSFKWSSHKFPLLKLLAFIRFIIWLKREIGIFKPDIIFSHGLNISILSIISAPNKLKSRIITCDHNSFDDGTFFWKKAREILYKKIGKVISLTNEDLPNYEKIHDSVCIHNPISIQTPTHSVMQRNNRALAVGRLTRQKGFDLLIEAWEMVADKHPEWSLDIVGDGNDRELLQSMVEDKNLSSQVNILPATDDIVDFYKNSNVFILSSRHEGLPLVLIEVLAFGIPAIAFQCKTGPKDVLLSGGKLVEPENIQKLAQAIIYFIEHPEDWSALSNEAMAISGKFSVEKYHLAHINLINETIGKNSF